MKFTVSKSAFLEKLIPAMGSVSVKNTIRSIEGVLIEAKNTGKIEISTYDMNKGFKASIDAEAIEREGKYIINAQRLLQTIRVLSEDFFTIEVNEDNLTCNIKSGRSDFSMQAMRGSEFPSLPELSDEKGYSVSAPLFKKLISKIIHSVSDTDRANINGAYIKISENNLKMVSCNGVSLSVAEAVCDIEAIGDDEKDTVLRIPGHALGELVKIIPDGEEDKISVFIARKHAVIKIDDIIFFTRTVDGDYIEYERLLPASQTIFVTLEKENFLAGLERATLIADEKIQGSGRGYVKICVKGDEIELESVSANGKVYDEIDCTHEGDDITIGFNCRLLMSSVKVLEGENIKMTMKSPTQAITLEPAEENENEKYFYMVLPVKMNG